MSHKFILPPQPTFLLALPEDSYEGPKLEAGEDYSQDRKNDYETETTNGYVLCLPCEQSIQGVVTYMSLVEVASSHLSFCFFCFAVANFS